MIRQTRTYLVGAMSGATLIAIAIAAFVVLVSAQVFSDWPLSTLRGSGPESSVSNARATAGGDEAAASAAVAASAGTAGADAPGNGKDAVVDGNRQSTGVDSAAAPLAPASEGGPGGGSGESGSGSDPVATTPSDSGGESGGSGSRSSSGGGSSSSTTTSSPSRTVGEAVNNTVSGVDQTVTGGNLQGSGVTPVVEGVVDGVAGPESTVGEVVDKTVEAVGGILTPKR
jgi:hypothetical protein